MAVTPSSQTVQQGDSVAYGLTVTPVSGFAGAVVFSVSGLPAGSKNSFTGSGNVQTLNVAIGASAADGAYPLTITGTSGALTRSATATLLVGSASAQPDFAIAAAPASLSVQAGNSANTTATISAIDGWSSGVTLSASGLPSGVAASFSSDTITGSGASTLNLAIAAGAAAGTSTITVIGTAGALTHSAPIALQITAAAQADFSVAVAPGSITLTFTGVSGPLSHSVTFGLTVTAAPPPNTGTVFSDDAEHGNMGGVFTSPAFSLEGVRKATLTFFYKFETEQYYDNFYVWASGDDGRHWTKLAAGSGQSQGWNGWAPEATVDMSKFAGKSRVRISFSLQSDNSVTNWGVALDDISVTSQ